MQTYYPKEPSVADEDVLAVACELYAHHTPIVDNITNFTSHIQWVVWRVRHCPLSKQERTDSLRDILILCSAERQFEILTFLLEVGADPAATTSQGQLSALYVYVSTETEKHECLLRAMEASCNSSIEKRNWVHRLFTLHFSPPGLSELIQTFIEW